MITIPVRVCGDYWINPAEVKSQLELAAGKNTVVLDLQAEGPSLGSIGVVDVIDKYCYEYQVETKNIYIQHWSNHAETVEYSLLNTEQISHFFDFSRQYWSDTLLPATHKYVFGFFIGRRSIPRAAIMYELYNLYGSQNLLSALKNKTDKPWHKQHNTNIDKLDSWVPKNQQKNFADWWDIDSIPSIDNHAIADQYDPELNTNKDLVKYYHCFDIELVAESYTRGITFFPTEKTVRPLMAAKPFLVYGPKNYLENLHKLGFKTYQSLWDESYDCYEGPARWNAMKLVINSIMTLYSEDRLSILQQAQKIAEYNRKHLASIIKYDITNI